MARAKLNRQQVRDMRKKYKASKATTYRDLAEEYGVSHMAVWKAVTGKTWKDVNDDEVDGRSKAG